MGHAQSKIKLVYFNIAGLAEVPRLLLKVGNVEFEDYRISSAEFAEKKVFFPNRKVPVLYVDEGVYCQSNAIIRYCAKISGLSYDDPILQLGVDEIVASVEELRDTFTGPFIFESDSQKKEQKYIELTTTVLPTWLGAIEKRVNVLGTNGYAVGDKLSAADVSIFVTLGWMCNELVPFSGLPASLVDQYPALTAIRRRVAALPAVAAHYDLCPASVDPSKPSLF